MDEPPSQAIDIDDIKDRDLVKKLNEVLLVQKERLNHDID